MDHRSTLLFLEKRVDMVAPALDGLTLEVFLKGWTDTISLEPTWVRFFAGGFLDVDLEVTDVMKVAAAERLDHAAVVAFVKAEHLTPAIQLVVRTLQAHPCVEGVGLWTCCFCGEFAENQPNYCPNCGRRY